MSNQEEKNSQEVLEKNYTSKDFIKDVIKLQEAGIDEIVEYASKNFDLDTTQINSFQGVIGEIKGNIITSVLAWDTSKSTGENIAYVTGSLIQDYGEGLLVGMIPIGGFPAFTLGLFVSYVAKQAGVDLGQEFEKVYNYTQDFQSTYDLETQRFEQLKQSNLEAYNNMVQSGVYPQNTPVWNKHINELTKDLYTRKAENLKSTINYENNEIIDENNSLSQIAQKNGLTEKQLLDYNNLKVKEDDYNNIQDGTKIAIPNKPDVNEGVTVFTDDKGNQKIIVEDNSGKTKVFYYNAEDYSLLEIDGNEQIYNRVNADGSVTTQKLGIGNIQVKDSSNVAEGVIVKNISDANYELVYDSNSNIHPNTQLDVLLRQKTNSNLPLKDLAIANGYVDEAELREAFANGKTIITPTKQIISKDTNTTEYNMGENKVTKLSFNENSEAVIDTQISNSIETPIFEKNIPSIDNGNYILNDQVISLNPGQTISHIAQKTPYNSIELLEYNNLTLEDAKNLPVGYKVLVPKEPPLEIQGENGVIKLFKNPDDTFTLRVPDENNNKINITYDENSDLLIYGDKTNPNKITFTQDGIYEVWEKDSKGIMYQKE
ncbi:LysM peptidoglycan-binding domain-containing protein, partial [Malaciobacter mytili]|uniref:LysM peptidoglycan-binding domain-containing protein n=1 Tax=Malaciobacter mytili TaxID=603050 RepID=UPI003A891085